MSRVRSRSAAALAAGTLTAILTGGLLLGACDTGRSAGPGPNRPTATTTSAPGPTGPSSRSAGPPGSSAATGAAPGGSPGRHSPGTAAPSLPPEPTTTNTLPPPPEPTGPAPKTSGPLSAKDLPRPRGWQTVPRPGGAEQGYRGNGTWTQGRDPRYAAQDAITIGCAPVTRDDYPDPAAALQGTYGKRGNTAVPGVGLVLQFPNDADASRYYNRYVAQVRACTDPDGPVVATIITSELGLIDHRSYADGTAWTEIAGRRGARVTLLILTDPDRAIDRNAAEAVLRDLPG